MSLVRRTPLNHLGKKAKRDRAELAESRGKVAARSGGRCEVRRPGCRGLAIHAHHRRRRSQGGGNDASNLVHVCIPCHDWIHANVAEARECGLLGGH